MSGRRRGVGGALARFVFGIASVPYGWAVARRNRRFDRGAEEVRQAGVPVISVGNLTVGGSGKTPMVVWLARTLRKRGVRVAILSRGYRAGADGRNDEALELELALPDVPHLQNPDRGASAEIATGELGSQLLVLDDGFQHRRLARDLDVVLLDAAEPFGFERLLPRGLLREPPAGLRRAQAVVLTRADMLDSAGRDAIRRRVQELAPRALWAEAIHQPTVLADSTGTTRPIQEIAGQAVAGFCGIGNPAGFRHTLEALGCRVVAWREFPDHHAYARADVEQLGSWAREAGASLLICTMKDLVKVRTTTVAGVPLYAVAVELSFLAGEADFETAMAPLVERALAIELPDAETI